MEQLDLFGFPVEPVKPAKKKEAAAKAKPAALQPMPPAPESIFAKEPEKESIVQIAEEEIAPVQPALKEEIVIEEVIPVPAITEVEVPEEPILEVVAAVELPDDNFDAVIVAEEPVTIETSAVTPEPVEPAIVSAAAEIEEPEIIVKPLKAVKPKVAPVTVVKTVGKRGRKSFKEMDSEADLVEVPEESVLQQKLYYPISEVAGWFKVNTSLLRFWENEFDILQPRKTRKGDRLFRVEDIKNLQLIYFLLRQRKFSIDGAKKYLKSNKKEADAQAQVIQSLNRFKSFLLELKTNLAS